METQTELERPIDPDPPVILSDFQAQDLIDAHKQGLTHSFVSLDLGLSDSEVDLSTDGVLLRRDVQLDWDQIYSIHADENSCFLVRNLDFEKIISFSERFNRVYSLMPTRSAPTLLISGIPIHRVKNTDPWQDTLYKIKAVEPLLWSDPGHRHGSGIYRN